MFFQGFLWHSGKHRQYTKPFRENVATTVGIFFDGIAGTITYFKDGVSLGKKAILNKRLD